MVSLWVPLWVPSVPPLVSDAYGPLWTKFWLNLRLFKRLRRPESPFNTLMDAQNTPFAATLNQ